MLIILNFIVYLSFDDLIVHNVSIAVNYILHNLF